MTDNNAGQSQEICAVKLFSLKVLTMHIFNESFFLGSSYFLKVVRNETFFYLQPKWCEVRICCGKIAFIEYSWFVTACTAVKCLLLYIL